MATQNDSKTEALIIKDFFSKVSSHKYFYIFCVILFMVLANMINNYSETIYEVNSVIGPVEDRRSDLLRGSDNLFGGIGAFADSRNLENDMISLNSFRLVSSTLSDLNMEVGYFWEKNKLFENDQQLYPNSPIKVIIDKSHIQPIDVRFYIDILSDSTYRLTASEDQPYYYNYLDNIIINRDNVLKIDEICKFNETISSENFKFSISFNKSYFSAPSSDTKRLYFELYHLDDLTKQYLSWLKIEPVNIKSSLIKVYFQGANMNLTIDFLNYYLQTYLNDNLSKKNKIARNTINFIDSQISEISDSLILSESKLRDYRSAHQVTDLTYQGQQALELMNQLERERSTLQIQERYYNYILDYFNKNEDMAGIAPPSAANVSDPIMNQLVMELISLNAQRSTILSDNTGKNLFLGQIENQIKLQKRTIIENVSNNLNTLNLTQNELNYRAEKLSRQISNLPRTELNMVSMQRQFNLSDAIYTYMLQKRSEAAITMASNYPDYEILEPARSISYVILSPKKMRNNLIALFVAILIPTGFIILKNFFSDKVTSVAVIQQFINKPVLGTIFSNSYKEEAVVSEYPASSIAESFRNLRTNLFVKFDKTEQSKIILITSSQPQDGKSFISFNLAASIAAVGYKTVILDCDLRRPTLHTKFKEDKSPGLSNFMTNHTSKENIIHSTSVNNLAFIPAGPLLPNPSELMEKGILDDLIVFLQARYEYIILDTTPAGIVADAALLMKYATYVLLVCRNNHTRKEVFKDVITMFSVNKVENFDVVFNDLDIKSSHYGHYDNYFNREKKKPFPIKKIKEVKEETA